MNDILIDTENNIVKINGSIIKQHEFLEVKFEDGEWSYIISDKNPFINKVISK